MPINLAECLSNATRKPHMQTGHTEEGFEPPCFDANAVPGEPLGLPRLSYVNQITDVNVK